MCLFFLCLYIVLLGVGLKFLKDIISRIVFLSFISYWMIIMMISMMNPYELFPVSDRIYFYSLLSVFAFTVGFLLYPLRNFASISTFDIVFTELKAIIYNKLFISIYICMLGLIIYTYIKSATALAMLYAMGRGRGEELMSMVFDGSSFHAILYNMFAPAFFHITLFIVVYLVLYEIKKWRYILFYGVYVLLYASIGGGRNSFIYILIYFLFFIFIRKSFVGKSFKISSFKKIIIGVFAFVAIFFVSKISYEREFKGDSANRYEKLIVGFDFFCKDLIIYNVSSFRLFEYAIENDYRNRLNDINISATFESLDPYLRVLSRLIGVDYNLKEESVVSYLQNSWVYTGVHESNYIYTALLFHYIDLGVVGLIIFPFIFGIVYRYVINDYYRFGNIFLLLLIFFFYFMMLNTVLTCYLAKVFAIPYCLVLFLLSKIKKFKKSIG